MLDDTLLILGYRPEDDSWDTDRRRTYIHDDSASRAWMVSLARVLGRQGWDRWEREFTTLRGFQHPDGLVIEVEPGGSETSGHYLHLMKAPVIA